MKRSHTFIAIPPGETIKEQLEDRNMSQKEFASRMAMSEKHISNLINGKVELTAETAFRLEMVLGTPASFWNNLEAVYREKLVKIEAENSLEADQNLARDFPYDEMSEYGWIDAAANAEDQVLNLRKFFEVIHLEMLHNPALLPAVVYHRLSIAEKTDYAAIAWVQKAKTEARKIRTGKINLSRLSKAVNRIRSFTTKNPADFIPELTHLLADCGIALVLLPYLNGLSLQGAAFYDRNKIVIALPFQNMDADKFWFSLFHEIGHIVMGHPDKAHPSEKDETNADQFSWNILIPSDQLQSFSTALSLTKDLAEIRNSILHFSEQIGIHPGIVVSRLQKDGVLQPDQLNDLKTIYSLDSEFQSCL